MALPKRSIYEGANPALEVSLIAMTEIMELAIIRLAEEKKGADLAWFTEIRSKALEIAKGVVVEHISGEAEVEAIEFAIRFIDIKMEALRYRILNGAG